jgi:hypothetical protein
LVSIRFKQQRQQQQKRNVFPGLYHDSATQMTGNAIIKKQQQENKLYNFYLLS